MDPESAAEIASLRAENAALRMQLASEKESVDHVDEWALGANRVRSGTLSIKKRRPPGPGTLKRQPSLMNVVKTASDDAASILDKFLDTIRQLATYVDPLDVAERIVDATCALVQCDRATFFFVDDDCSELVLLVARGSEDDLRVKKGVGFAGWVYEHGETLNVPDAYQDPRFDSSFDDQTGFCTSSVLATAIFDSEGDIIAVLQAVNKVGTSRFSEVDQIVIENLASFAGIILRNAQYFEQTSNFKEQQGTLLALIKLLHSEVGGHSVVTALQTQVPRLIGADRCSLFAVDHGRHQVTLMSGDLLTDLTFPIGKGIAGVTAESGTSLNIQNARADPRFNDEFDKQSGYVTRSVLCMPIFNRSRKVIGVIQVINKVLGNYFEDQDEEILGTLLHIAGSILETEPLFQQHEKKLSEAFVARDLTPVRRRSRVAETIERAIIEEDEESGGED